MVRLALALACALGLSSVVYARTGDTLAGTVSVVDGDTLDLHGQRIRLWGVDAPESRQLCRVDGQPWRCGQAAALALSDHIGRRVVHCEELDTDRWKRIVARCRVAGDDLGAWLVGQGLALAFVRYSEDYVADEARARAGRRGIWKGTFAPPWEWRRDRNAPMITAAAG
ncbi:MAG: thermonuclease family protein [Geminicoccaceae bacterium]